MTLNVDATAWRQPASSGVTRRRSRVRTPSDAPKLSCSPAATWAAFLFCGRAKRGTNPHKVPHKVRVFRGGQTHRITVQIANVPREETVIRNLKRADRNAERFRQSTRARRSAILSGRCSASLTLSSTTNRHHESCASGAKQVSDKREPTARGRYAWMVRVC